MTLQYQLRYLGFSAAIAIAVCGCGSNEYQKAAVTGIVTCGDKPAWGGVVMFKPLDAPDKTGRPKGNPGNVSLGKVEQDGTFRLKYEPRGSELAANGALIGPHEVTFIPPMTEPPKWSSQDNWLPEEEKTKLKQQLAAEPVYPALECGNTMSPGEVDVKSGKNEFTFRLSVGRPKGKAATQAKKGGSD